MRRNWHYNDDKFNKMLLGTLFISLFTLMPGLILLQGRSGRKNSIMEQIQLCEFIKLHGSESVTLHDSEVIILHASEHGNSEDLYRQCIKNLNQAFYREKILDILMLTSAIGFLAASLLCAIIIELMCSTKHKTQLYHEQDKDVEYMAQSREKESVSVLEAAASGSAEKMSAQLCEELSLSNDYKAEILDS